MGCRFFNHHFMKRHPGPVNQPLIIDDYLYEDVNGGKCTASVCHNISEHLLKEVEINPKARYMAICVPCYNENVEELMKTLISLMQSVDFMQRTTKLYGDDPGQKLKDVFVNTIPVIVPIFDGTRALSPAMKRWLSLNFKGALDGMCDGTASGPGKVDVRVASSRWWYYPDSAGASNNNSNVTVARSNNNIIKRDIAMPSVLGVGNHNAYSPGRPHQTMTRVVSLQSKASGGVTSSDGSSPACARSHDDDSYSKVKSETDGDEEIAQNNKNNDELLMSESQFSFDDVCKLNNLSTDDDDDHSESMPSVSSTFSSDFNMDDLIFFHIVPIIKRSNHRKHNSHEWFFNSICEGLDRRVRVVFLTDCGTTYHNACLARLYYELYFKKDLIGVTASQKVETPNEFFHPCEDSPFFCFRGDHTKSGDRRPCWKCYATYLLSPAPLQGFEFEATLIMNSAMFNLVEALPVMPGPCQLLDWQKMKKHNVVSAYFNLLFEDESNLSTIPRLPRGMLTMETEERETGSGEKVGLIAKKFDNVDVTFTECLRVNMRLAEDRILSFVSVFCTGDGTKWIPDASFCYTPEILWQTLLTQRRRWLNGTFASFLFFFNSSRAKTMIWGGRFDPHKAGNSLRILNMLWSLQLYQLLLVLISPAIFGCASYIGVKDCIKVWPYAFRWATSVYFGAGSLKITGAVIWLVVYFIVYSAWTFLSFYRAKMPEALCQILTIVGFVFVFPIYLALWTAAFTDGLNLINGMVVATLLIPVVIASSQSTSSAMMYVMYLPWFLFLILFFLVYIPSYSFARLWDTTWGNRAGGSDSAISDNVQATMKSQNFLFVCFLVLFNIGFTWCLIRLLDFGYSVVLGFMCVVFFPMLIQLVSSFIFLFVAIPLRNLVTRQHSESEREESSLASVCHDCELTSLHNSGEYSNNNGGIGANCGIYNTHGGGGSRGNHKNSYRRAMQATSSSISREGSPLEGGRSFLQRIIKSMSYDHNDDVSERLECKV